VARQAKRKRFPVPTKASPPVREEHTRRSARKLLQGTPIPPESFFIAGAVSQYLGAALAVVLFSHIPAAGVGWLRVASAAGVLAAWRRPWRRWPPNKLGLAAAFGIALACMNISFYLALSRLPLGTTVAIEFVGPITVAALGSRTRRDVLALGLCALGVLAIADVQASGSLAGVLFAICAAALWAGYIILGHRVARQGPGVDGLAIASVAGALIVAPFAGPFAVPAFKSFELIGASIAVGLLSSVIPYALDQLAMARLKRGRFALLLALLPTTAALVGVVLLGQVPHITELVGIACVVLAAVLARRADMA
jgi:inner membrane transporter RhtA